MRSPTLLRRGTMQGSPDDVKHYARMTLAMAKTTALAAICWRRGHWFPSHNPQFCGRCRSFIP